MKTKKSNSKDRHAHTISVDFTCQALEAKEVFVAGTFNEWKPDSIPLLREEGGKWTTKLSLAPGNYEFKFIVDGQWCCEAGYEQEYSGCKKCCPNEMGTMNRVLEVAP